MAKETVANLAVVVPLAAIDDDWRHNASRQFVSDAHKAFALKEMWESQGYKDLKTNIKEVGLKNPLAIRRSGVKGGKSKEFILVSGFRRIHALKELEHQGAPCIIEPDSMDDAKAFEANVLENILRESVTKFGVAQAAVQYYERFGGKKNGDESESSGDVAKRFGVSSSYLRGIVMVRRNCPDVLLIAWAERSEETDGATFKATTWPRMLEYAGMKGKDGKPDHKAMIAAFELARMTEKLTNAKTSGEEAEKQAKEILEKGGYTFDPLTGEEGGTGKGAGNGKGKSIPTEFLRLVKRDMSAGTEKLNPTDREMLNAAIATLDYLLKRASRGPKYKGAIKVGKVTLYETPRGDVKK